MEFLFESEYTKVSIIATPDFLIVVPPVDISLPSFLQLLVSLAAVLLH